VIDGDRGGDDSVARFVYSDRRKRFPDNIFESPSRDYYLASDYRLVSCDVCVFLALCSRERSLR